MGDLDAWDAWDGFQKHLFGSVGGVSKYIFRDGFARAFELAQT